MSSLIFRTLPSIIHPITHLILQRAIALAAAYFTPAPAATAASSSSLRYIAVALIFLTTYSYLSTCHLYMENRTWKSIWGFLSTQFLAVYTERLLVSGWNWNEDEGPRNYTRQGGMRGRYRTEKEKEVLAGSKIERDGGDDPTVRDRIISKQAARRNGILAPKEEAPSKYCFALSFLFGTRGVNKPWQSKNVPPLSSHLYPTLPPNRSQFLLRRCLTVILAFLILDIGTFQPLNPKIFDVATIPVFARLPFGITSNEILSRIVNTIANWVINYAFICFFANLWACFAVGVGLSVPEAWPPGFGVLRNAWTLRRFWGTFWHQHFRTTLEGLSSALVHNVLRLPRSGLLARYSKLFFAFVVSGCMHIGHDIGGAVEVRNGAMRFFCTQFLGVIIEDTVQAQWSRMKTDRHTQHGKAANWKRLIGYTWVLVFLVWSTPVFQYPVMMAKRPAGDEMLPFSVVQVLLGNRWVS